MKSLIIMAAILFVAVRTAKASDPVVNTEQGRIIGKRIEFIAKELNFRKPVDAFWSIPYAEAPIKALRFKPPVPKKWKGELDARQYRSYCPQPLVPLIPIDVEKMDEDCLFLDIFVPVPTPTKAAVMFWIHGGAFMMGAGNIEELDSSPIAAFGDVIVVAINYRLGALGFLSTGDEIIPGSMGMLDQVEAMKWVTKNIAAFGGDPERVTIWGVSAGAGSVGLHTLSPLSKGLFTRGIMQSGDPLSPWACNEDPQNYAKRAFALGKLVGCNSETTKQLLECLVDVSADDIVNASQRMMEVFPEDPGFMPFAPVIDGTFLPEAPSALFEKRLFNIENVMAGYNANEGTVFGVMLYPNATEKPHLNLTEFETFVTIGKLPLSHPLQRGAMELVYFDNSIFTNPNANYFDPFVSLNGDFFFTCSQNMYLRAVNEAKVGQTYAYYFNHHPSISPFNAPWSGACHGDDIMFFGAHFLPNEFNLTDAEVDMTVKMIKYWTNFAKTGNPNIASKEEEVTSEGAEIDWPQFTVDNQVHKELSPEMKNIGNPRIRECRLWNDYLPKLAAVIADLEDCHQDKSCKTHWGQQENQSCDEDTEP